MVPFFWFVILSVHESAVSRILSVLFRDRIMLFLKNPISLTLKWMVRFELDFCFFLVDLVYSPTRSK